MAREDEEKRRRRRGRGGEGRRSRKWKKRGTERGREVKRQMKMTEEQRGEKMAGGIGDLLLACMRLTLFMIYMIQVPV